jgi:hypothetical protein
MTQWRPEDLIGGDAVLDFVNTVGDTDKNRDMERLASWSDAVGWARFVKLLTPAEAAALRSAGFDFYDWAPGEVRLVTSWDQSMAAVERLAAAIAAL